MDNNEVTSDENDLTQTSTTIKGIPDTNVTCVEDQINEEICTPNVKDSCYENNGGNDEISITDVHAERY